MKNGNGGSSILGVLALIAALAAGILLIRGAVLSIFTLLRWVLLGLAILAAVVLAAVFFGLHLNNRDEKQKAPAKQTPTQKELDTLGKSRRALTELRMKSIRLRDGPARSEMEQICQQFARILQALKEQPGTLGEARQCLTYYLPTLGEVTGRYLALEASGTLTAETSEKFLSFLSQVQEALDRQYRSLFEDDALDLTVDMEALTLALQRDGLL